MTGYFISFEGPDGAGKTTALKGVIQQISKQLNQDYLLTREPGGSNISERIRDLILDPDNTEMDARTEALLYAASRGQLVAEVLKPALASGKIVFCDRYVDSSLAYQGQGRDLGIEEVARINNFATNGLQPDLTLFLNLDPSIGLVRISNLRHEQEDRMEQEKLAFHQKVYQGYLRVAQLYPERIEIINANQAPDAVVDACVRVIKQRLPQIFRSNH